MNAYKLRWSIESLFGQLKTRGFNFEETHLRCEKRLSQLLALMTIGLAWAYLTGMWREQSSDKPPTKNHGYRAISLFRHGFDYLIQAFVNPCVHARTKTICIGLLKPKKRSQTQESNCQHLRDVMKNFIF